MRFRPVSVSLISSNCTHLSMYRQSEVAEQVRETAGVDDSVPQLVIVDLTLGHRFVLDEGVTLTADRVAEFVDLWRRRQLEPVPFDTPC